MNRMTEIDQIRYQLEKAYEAYDSYEKPNLSVPTELLAYKWATFAVEYIYAASILAKEEFRFIKPQMLLTGHAIECVLKAYLVASRSDPPDKHDLVQLYNLAKNYGYQLNDKSLAMIVPVNHYYYKDLGTKTKYKARYPTKTSERSGGSVPPNSICISIVNTLIEQISNNIVYPFREMFDSLKIYKENLQRTIRTTLE